MDGYGNFKVLIIFFELALTIGTLSGSCVFVICLVCRRGCAQNDVQDCRFAVVVGNLDFDGLAHSLGYHIFRDNSFFLPCENKKRSDAFSFKPLKGIVSCRQIWIVLTLGYQPGVCRC
jgi:hypothetical protein